MADAERAWQVIRQHHAAIAHDNAEVPGGQVGMTCAHTESGPGFTERMLAAGEGCLLLEATGPGVFERFV
ncbi:MAG TPA: hypothetical protein VFV41_24225, partial [Streptosporangiaceae bacterium]|nr:hypothetical protein [Streptosporangiaceae bacterium]